MKLRRFPLLLAIIVLTTAVPALAELYTDWLWFAHVGYGQVFVKSLGARALLTVLSGVAVFALLGGNLWLALRVPAAAGRSWSTTPQGPQALTFEARTIRRLAMGAVAVISLARGRDRRRGMGDVAVLPERHPVRMHSTPCSGWDIGFYLFTLPLLEGVHNLLFVLTLVAAVATVVVYVLGEEVGLEPTRGLFVSRRATRHLAVLAALLLVVLGFGAWLQIP